MKRIKTWLATVAVLLSSMAVNATTFEDWTSTNKGQGNTTSSNNYTIPASAGDVLTFDWLVSSESGYDKLIVTLNGTEILNKSGELSGTYQHTFTSSGTYTMVVKYTKDGGVNKGSDYAKVFNINKTSIIIASGTCGENLTWELTEGGELRVDGTGDMMNFENQSARPWDNHRDKICTIVVSEGVEYISINSFCYCNNLISISIPESVVNIGYQAFMGCNNLESISLPESLEVINGHAFDNCSLTSIILPASLKVIGGHAFDNCSLNSITCMAVTPPVSYDIASFYSGDKSIPVYVPSSSVSAYQAADYWKEFTNIQMKIIASGTCGKDLTWKLTSDSLLIINGTGAMNDYYNEYSSNPPYAPWNSYRECIKEVFIDSAVTTIGKGAFYYCSNLKSINIPLNITSIANHAFYGCNGLEEVIIEDGSTVLSLECNLYDRYNDGSGEGLFADCPLKKVYVGRNLGYNESSYYGFSPFQNKQCSFSFGENFTIINSYFFYGNNMTSLIVPQNVREIESYAFSGCKNLGSIIIPEKSQLTTMHMSAFNGVSSLISVNMPDDLQLTSINNYTFSGCSNLTSITIPKNVISIGDQVFSGCSSLSSIAIPNSVTVIGDNAFDGCSSLKEIEFKDGKQPLSLGYKYSTHEGLFKDSPLETIYLGRDLKIPSSSSNQPFYMKETLTTLTIGDSVTSINNSLFYTTKNLTTLTIGKNVSSIGGSAFAGCVSLTSITIPDSTISIGSSAFSGCSSLKSLIIGKGVSDIGSSAFRGCTNLNSVIIPNGVISIGGYAFYGCTNLNSVVIPDGVTSVGSYAFGDCFKLNELTIGSKVSSIGNYAFAGCNDIESIYALNTKAITCDESIFATDTYNNATLYVPEGREQAYAKATPWSKFYIQTITEPTESYDVKIGSAGYATLYLDYAVERPRGVEAYYIGHVVGNTAIMKAVWDYIPANTGVILRGAKGTYTFTSTDEDVEAISDNLLRGTVVDKDIRAQKNTTYYALGRVDGVVGLYRAELEDGYFFNNANKAYLALTSDTEEDDDSGQLARSLILRFPNGSTTTITEVMGGDENEEVIYDMQGRRLTEITEPGVYIINGRKVWR